MLIDPKVKKLVIFNAGGGIVEREIKLSVQQGINEYQIQNVPASFDPASAEIKLEYINPEDKEFITLQQTIVSLPDSKNVQQIIDREKSAANSIISYSIDFTRELREEVSKICEASSYRTYSDMNATFNFIINASRKGDVIVKILYFIRDLRIRWETTLQVSINNDGKTAEMEGFIVVDNHTGFSYNNVELSFAIFELPHIRYGAGEGQVPPVPIPPESTISELRGEMMEELNQLQRIQKAPMKRTQRFKKLL